MSEKNNDREYTSVQIAIIRRKKIEEAARKKAEKEQSIALTAPTVPAVPRADMQIAKIRNRYMFNSNNPLGEHTYLVYKDKETEEVRAVETTHLYVPDSKNMSKVKRGLLLKVQLAGYETPSGVNNSYYNTNIEGEPIDLNHSDVKLSNTFLSSTQEADIKRFIKGRRENQAKEKS